MSEPRTAGISFDDLTQLLTALIFVALFLRRPLRAAWGAWRKRRRAESDGFERPYDPIEPE